MLKRILVVVAALAAVVVLATPAAAAGAGAVSVTQTFHNVTQTFTPPDPMASNPCTGAPGILTLTYNGVSHMTFLTSGVGAGTGWGTFTATGAFTFVQSDPAVTFTGRFTTWDGFSMNLNNFTSTGTLNGRGTGSDGSSLTFHSVFHITGLNTNPPTIVVTFGKLNCG
ncbi:MAG: hypothetical protein E6J06_07225 [Chloroflexi bacterium]|nr:MAG: hypothetical protein E6J06_07225 [Chloroflexota bacterium]